MTEAEIVYQMSETINRGWSLLQWWVSISFGILAVAHLASEKLNAIMLLIVTFLYVSFSLMVRETLQRHNELIAAYGEGLNVLIESGVDLAHGTNHLINQEGPAGIAASITIVGTFFSVIAYLVYRYWESRHN